MTAPAAARGFSAFALPKGSLRRHASDRRLRRRALRVPLLLGALTAFSTLLAFGSPLGASTTGGLHARADTIVSTIAQDNNVLAGIGERYLREDAAAEQAEGEVVAERAMISTLGNKIAIDREALAHAAIDAYIGAGNTSSVGLLLNHTPDQVSIGQAYLGFASGQLTSSVARYSDEQHELSVASMSELAALQREQTAANSTKSYRASVLREVEGEQQLLNSVNGQLAQLVAKQAAAQAAAAAAAAAQAASTEGGPTQPSAAAALNALPPSGSFPSATLANEFLGIRQCESGDNYGLDDGNGYFGAYQFSLGTWESVGGTGLPSSAAPPTQDSAAYQLYERSGFEPWPECAAILGLG